MNALFRRRDTVALFILASYPPGTTGGYIAATLQRVDPASESEAFFTELLYEVRAELQRERRDDDEAFGPE
jgi:hypothetical protein